MAVDNVGMNVPIKFGDSCSNGFRNIRGADFVANERILAKFIPIVRNAFRLKMYHIQLSTSVVNTHNQHQLFTGTVQFIKKYLAHADLQGRNFPKQTETYNRRAKRSTFFFFKSHFGP